MLSYKQVILFNFLLIITINNADFPPDIPHCRAGDGECIAKVTNEIVEKYHNGREDIAIPKFEPFHVSEISLNQGANRPINVNIFLKDATVHGLSKIRIDRVVGFTRDPKTSKFELYGKVPQLRLNGKYKADGRILLLPIQGEGDFELILDDVKGAIKLKPSVSERNGKHYLQVDKIKILLEPSGFKIKLTNLFNGNQELSNSLHEVLNANWGDAWNEVAPSAIDVVERVVVALMNPVFNLLPYDDYYLPE